MKTKNILLFFFSVFMLVGYTGCEKDVSIFMQVKETAWNLLTVQEKSTVNIDWKDAEVKDESYNDENVYAVTFSTTDNALLGPIIVYINKSSLEVVGKGLRM